MRNLKIIFFLLHPVLLIAQKNMAQDCVVGEMVAIEVWSFYGTEAIQKNSASSKNFIIRSDLNTLSGEHFISDVEHYYRQASVKLDTTNFEIRINENWKNLSYNQKLDLVFRQKQKMLDEASSVNKITSEMERIVFFINNTNDQIVLHAQWGAPIMILQALDQNNNWKNVQFWDTGYGCVEALPFVYIPKNQQFSVVTNFPKGNYKTKLRYKILGYNTFYYSEEFESNINYCAFVEECHNCELRNRLLELPEKN